MAVNQELTPLQRKALNIPSRNQIKRKKALERSKLISSVFNCLELRQQICKFLPVDSQLSLWSTKTSWSTQLEKMRYVANENGFGQYSGAVKHTIKCWSYNYGRTIINSMSGTQYNSFESLLSKLTDECLYLRSRRDK
jgi:hypothetical protein